jgi:glycosyltransferase involved in cell wall biosynthesis
VVVQELPHASEQLSATLDNSEDASAATAKRVAEISAVIATRNRAESLLRTLGSLSRQSLQPSEILVVDGSDDSTTRNVCDQLVDGLQSRICYLRAEICGAASQRNQGVLAAHEPVIWFLDDDIELQPECAARIYSALTSDSGFGGVNAMIVNQAYHVPGRISRAVYSLLNGKTEMSWAGRVIGPAINLLPEDRADLPDLVDVDWLNTTCVMYRREALPTPPFSEHFTGYSMMEDLALSLNVGRHWRLVNARTARIFHDSQPGSHKADPAAMAEMELVNRHHVMTRVLGRRRLRDYLKLFLFEAFQQASALRSKTGKAAFIPELRGRLRGAIRILRT